MYIFGFKVSCHAFDQIQVRKKAGKTITNDKRNKRKTTEQNNNRHTGDPDQKKKLN